MILALALGGMVNVSQWFMWRLQWDGVEQKYIKTPCALDGSVYRIDASDPESWASFDTVALHVRALNASPACADRQLQYAQGFYLTAECGYWFLDIDKCVENGALSQFATGMLAAFPGSAQEYSSSGRGVHAFGRCSDDAIPLHGCRNKQHNMEFYTEGRGIAFGLDDVAQGCADVGYPAAHLQVLIDTHFPYVERTASDVARPEWRGPSDDDELIRRALAARESAEVVLGGKPGFRKLWSGDCEHDSSADMALATHLAFWTGCDAPRIERLMRRSGMVRDKWDTHRPGGTYLTFTIGNACDVCSRVYQEPERSIAVQTEMYGAPVSPVATTLAPLISPEVAALVDQLMDLVTACGTAVEMHNVVIPAIREAGVPSALSERLAKTVKRQLDLWDAGLPIGKIRALISPPVVGRSGDAPEWVQKHCYVKDGDFFYDLETGAKMTFQGFLAEYGRLMPMKDNGSRENAIEWALNRWGMRTVHHLGYRPDRGPYYEWDGLEYANLCNAASIPSVATEYTAVGLAGIDAFQRLLWDMCDRRQDVYQHLLWWLAHNVQKPGIKIRWSPVLKGTQGDGKTLLTNVLRAAMGWRNVGVTGNSTLTASGGFNDWMVGSAVNVIEEIQLTGKERYKLYNAMKECIANDIVNVNAKGDKTYSRHNCTNHLANTNHNDAIPLEKSDRRWFVVFTPWSSLPDMLRYCALTGEGWSARTDAIDRAWREHYAELRAWFLSIPIGETFDIRGSAPHTPEKRRMMASSQDDAESVAIDLIAEGGHGITPRVLASACLTKLLKDRSVVDGFEVPRSTALNHMLTRLGFSKFERSIKWRGRTHTVWTRDGFNADNETIRFELDKSVTSLQPL